MKNKIDVTYEKDMLSALRKIKSICKKRDIDKEICIIVHECLRKIDKISEEDEDK